MLLFLNIQAFAGDGKGNGGKIISCKNTSSREHLLSLDLYETKSKHHLEIDIPKIEIPIGGNAEVFVAKKLIERISIFSPRRYQRLLKSIDEFYTQVKWINFPLGDIDDVGEYKIPEGCHLLLVVNQNKKILPKNKSYLIREKIWAKLSLHTKISLILHEVIYRDNPARTSEGIRTYTSYIIGNGLMHFDIQTYLEFLMQQGFKTNTIHTILADLSRGYRLFPNMHLQIATPVEGSSYQFQDHKIQLLGKQMTFYADGLPKEFCPLKNIPLQSDYGELKIKCARVTTVQFYQGMALKQAASDYQEIHGPYYSIFLGLRMPNFKSLGHFQLYENGAIKNVTESMVVALVDATQWVFDGRIKTHFFDNKVIKQGTLFADVSYRTNFGEITIGGAVRFNREKVLLEGVSKKNFTYLVRHRSIKFSGNTIVKFHGNGMLKKATVLKNTVFTKANGEKLEVKAFTQITFDNLGYLL